MKQTHPKHTHSPNTPSGPNDLNLVGLVRRSGGGSGGEFSVLREASIRWRDGRVLPLSQPDPRLISTTPGDFATLSRALVIGVPPNNQFWAFEQGGEFKGVAVELWQVVAAELGLNYTLQRFDNSSGFSDMIARLAGGEMDGFIGDVAVTPERAALVEFTQPHSYFGVGMAVLSTFSTPAFSLFTFLEPFQAGTWALLASASLAIGLSYAFLEGADCPQLAMRFAGIRWSAPSSRLTALRGKLGGGWVEEALHGVVGAANAALGTPPPFQSAARRLMDILLRLMAIAITSSYTAHLVAALVARSVQLPYSTLQDARDGGATFATTEGGVSYEILTSTSGLSIPRSRVQTFTTFERAAQAVVDGKASVLAGSVDALDEAIASFQPGCGLQPQGPQEGRLPRAFAFRPNFPATQAVSQNILLQLAPGGAFDRAWAKYGPRAEGTCLGTPLDASPPQADQITPAEVGGVVLCAVLATLLSVLVACAKRALKSTKDTKTKAQIQLAPTRFPEDAHEHVVNPATVG